MTRRRPCSSPSPSGRRSGFWACCGMCRRRPSTGETVTLADPFASPARSVAMKPVDSPPASSTCFIVLLLS